jgi:hypothetical protein
MKKTDPKSSRVVESNSKETKSFRSLPSVTFGRRKTSTRVYQDKEVAPMPPDNNQSTVPSEPINPQDFEGDKSFNFTVNTNQPVRYSL